MKQLIGAELLKVNTTRARYAYFGVIVLLGGIAVAGDIGSTPGEERGLLQFQLGLVETASFAALLALLLGITVITTEFRHGTVTPTFLAEPRRERVIAAKAAAAALIALFFNLVILVVIFAVALPWLSIIDAPIHLGDGDVVTRIAQTFLAAVLWALMGVAIGVLVHSQVAALVGTLVWVFLGETLLWGLFGWLNFDGAIQYLPFRSLDAVDGTGGEDVLAYGPGLGVALAWIALLGAAGIARTLRRDIT